MMAQPLADCVKSVLEQPKSERTRVFYMSPQGKTFTQQRAKEIVRDYDHLVLVCGHYEGVDERFIEECVDEELSLGDFVLTGGELAAMAVADCVCRMVPGVLSDEECYTGESHWDGLLEYPQYTRPESWAGREVPEVLRSGNQAEIDRWRRKQMLRRTMEKRPELFEKFVPDADDQKLIAEIRRDDSRLKLTEEVACRKTEMSDLENIMLTIRQARNYLKKHRVDQWQGEYPTEEILEGDIQRGECYTVTYGGRFAGFFVLSDRTEPDYEDLTDGKWRGAAEEACVLHRCAVMAEFRGSGLSSKMLGFAEELTLGHGRSALRVDTHRHNEAMKALLNGAGYTFRGNLFVFCEPYHDPRRQAFEKLLT